MKNFNKIYIYFFIIAILIFSVSCEKEDITSDENSNNLTKEIIKIETSYKTGDVKIEGFDNLKKVETESDNAFKQQILNELEKSYSKRTVLKNNGNKVGVIRAGSCGSHQTLDVYIDCEDHNPATRSYSWIGSNEVGSNAKLRFCVVDGTYFNRTGADYALLMLSTPTYWGDAQRIMRYIDTEDDGNANWAQLDGKNISGCYGDCYFSSNIRLSFFYYLKSGTTRYFPNIGIPYGVFGRFGPAQGWVYTDDEDNRNANSAYIQQSYYTSPVTTGNIPNIMDVGSNTRLYMSLAYYMKKK